MEKFSDIRDFLSNDSFIRWVLQGETSLFWESFVEQHPEKKSLFEEAQRIALRLQEAESNQEISIDSDKIWNRIQSEITGSKKESHWRSWTLKIAAVLTVVGSLGVWMYQSKTEQEKISYSELVQSFETPNPLIEVQNNSVEPKWVYLEDGSKISLKQHSKISYPKHFANEKRTVFLSGEAFFEIAKNPKKPFFVYANEVITKVLGTSFTIRAFDKDENVTVSVKTGRVNVFNQRRINVSDPETNGIILVPNQQAVFNRESASLSKALVAIPMPIISLESKEIIQRFDEVPVSQVLNSIARNYGIKILFNEDILSKCIITTSLKNEPIYDKLDLICQLIGGSYKVVDAQIIIESNGCQ